MPAKIEVWTQDLIQLALICHSSHSHALAWYDCAEPTCRRIAGVLYPHRRRTPTFEIVMSSPIPMQEA